MTTQTASEERWSSAATRGNDQRILIVDSDDQFREGLYNFLLAAGYKEVNATRTFHKAIEKIKKSTYDAVISEAGSRSMEVLSFVDHIATANPETKLILMLRVEDREKWKEKAGLTGIQFLLKPTFAQNLLYLLQTSVLSEP